jgi:hypothetical protein
MLSWSTRKHIDCNFKRSCARTTSGLSGTGNDGGITGAKTVLAPCWPLGQWLDCEHWLRDDERGAAKLARVANPGWI